jgi:trehalose-6-phosphate synthase
LGSLCSRSHFQSGQIRQDPWNDSSEFSGGVLSRLEGMNLTAKEFIAAQAAAGGSGVLVLSQHTGAAEELGAAALLTEPHSPEDLIDKLTLALTLPSKERRAHLQCLADLLGHHPPSAWASQIIPPAAIRDK